MSSDEVDATPAARSKAEGLAWLLDPAFGYFVWAAHLLAVYITAAVACVLGLGAASAATRSTFQATLALATVATAAVVLLHAARRYRQQREMPDLRFRMAVTIGGDAIAAVAIAWQLFPILLVPACA
jgi:membrane protein implicated in regulation of membrane protease activity